MRLDLLAKDGNSGNLGCPSVYLAADGSLVVQGNIVDGDTHDELHNVLPGEGAVHISADVVAAALRKLG